MKRCKKYCNFFLVFFIFIFFSKNVSADEKPFTCTEINFESTDTDVSSMGVHRIQVDNKNRLRYYYCDEIEKGDKYYFKLVQSITDKKGKITKSKIAKAQKTPHLVKCTDDEKIVMVFRNYGKKKTFHVNVIDKKGKKLADFEYAVKKSADYFRVEDVYIDGNKIYYAYTLEKEHNSNVDSVLYVECRNVKNNKLIHKNIIYKGNDLSTNSVKFIEGKLYVMNTDSITGYSLHGKKGKTYILPDSGRYTKDESDPFAILVSKEFSKRGDYIYYCNMKGIYRCSYKNNTEFEMCYDAADDEFFSVNYGFTDMAIDKNDDVYIALTSKDYEEIGCTTDIVKYSR